ncbi:MAG: NTPase [Euryarchaeota archaeon]|nr:NTPase [Euryarchaeota archaeon]
MNILITGSPGSGKTTVLTKIKDYIEFKGYSIGGVFCPEMREGRRRVGFNIIDIMSKKRGILAHVDGEGPRVGRYKVNLEDLEGIGISAVEEAIKQADYIMIDEIAPMELYSQRFCEAVHAAFNTKKTVLAVIHKKSKHPFVVEIKNRADVKIFEVSRENNSYIHEEILKFLEI